MPIGGETEAFDFTGYPKRPALDEGGWDMATGANDLPGLGHLMFHQGTTRTIYLLTTLTRLRHSHISQQAFTGFRLHRLSTLRGLRLPGAPTAYRALLLPSIPFARSSWSASIGLSDHTTSCRTQSFELTCTDLPYRKTRPILIEPYASLMCHQAAACHMRSCYAYEEKR